MEKKPVLVARRGFYWISVIVILLCLTALDGHMIITARGPAPFFKEIEMLSLLTVLIILASILMANHVRAARSGIERHLFWLGEVLFIYGLLAWGGQFLEAAKLKVTLWESVTGSLVIGLSVIIFALLPMLAGTFLMFMKSPAMAVSQKDIGITVGLFAVYLLLVIWVDPSSPYFLLELSTEIIAPVAVMGTVIAMIARRGGRTAQDADRSGNTAA